MTKSFTKIRKFIEEVGARISHESDYFDKITVELPNGKKFEFENKRSTSSRVISRGRGTKWSGNPAGFYMMEIPEKGYGGYSFQTTQNKAIEKMRKSLEGGN